MRDVLILTVATCAPVVKAGMQESFIVQAHYYDNHSLWIQVEFVKVRLINEL